MEAMIIPVKVEFGPFNAKTIQPRHFADDLGLANSQLHSWLGAAGMEESKRASGKWRTFSPCEVMALAALTWLKKPTDLAITRHPGLIAFLLDGHRFAESALAVWAEGHSPLLVTDLDAAHHVTVIEDQPQRLSQLLLADLTVVQNLVPVVEFSFRAVRLGGSSDQAALADRLSGHRERSLLLAGSLERGEAKGSPARHDATHRMPRAVNLSDSEDGEKS